ncbi:hypothetical protein [Saltatorellus ferox]|uniref:hypothetical protein n=1 Tax=Saltatorellus ferox TaxID=2528018 RepID=UPI003AF3B6A0
MNRLSGGEEGRVGSHMEHRMGVREAHATGAQECDLEVTDLGAGRKRWGEHGVKPHLAARVERLEPSPSTEQRRPGHEGPPIRADRVNAASVRHEEIHHLTGCT